MSLIMPASTRLSAWESGLATNNACKGTVGLLSPRVFHRETTSPIVPVFEFNAAPIAISSTVVGNLRVYRSVSVANSPRTASQTGMPRSAVTPPVARPPSITRAPRTGSDLIREGINTISRRAGSTTTPVAGHSDLTVLSKDGVSTGVPSSRNCQRDPLEEQRNEQIVTTPSPRQHQVADSPPFFTAPHMPSQLIRMVSAPTEDESLKKENTKDVVFSRRISVSTADASEDSGERFQSDDSCDAISESSCDAEEKLRTDRDAALDTTVASIEAFLIWLDESGQTLQSTTKVTDLSSDARTFFSRISHLVEFQMSPLPKEEASQYLWRMLLLGLRRERLRSVLATMFHRCNDLAVVTQARNVSLAAMLERCNDLTGKTQARSASIQHRRGAHCCFRHPGMSA